MLTTRKTTNSIYMHLFHLYAKRIQRNLLSNFKNYLVSFSEGCTGKFLMVIFYPYSECPQILIWLYKSYVERGFLHWNCSITRTILWYNLMYKYQRLNTRLLTSLLCFTKNLTKAEVSSRSQSPFLLWKCYYYYRWFWK